MDNRSIQQLDLNLLKIFESLYQEQNMSRVAEALFITPSAVSHAVKRLREALGDPLFERQGNRMKPTSACLRIAPQLLENLHALRRSLQQFSQFDPAISEQTFTIAIHDALEALYIPPLYTELFQTSENLQLSCIQLERNLIQRQLASGQADLAIDVALPLKAPIHHCRLVEDSFVLVKKYQINIKNKGISKEDYVKAKHLTVSNRPTGRVVEDINLQQQSINRQVAMRCQNYQTAKALLKSSDLWLTAPKLIAQALDDQDIDILPLPFAVPNIEIHLYWHENTSQDAAINWLKQRIVELATDKGQSI